MMLELRLRRLPLAAIFAIALAAGLTAPAPASPPPRQQVQGEVLAPSGPRMVGPVWAGACDFVDATSEYATRTSPTLFRIRVAASTRGRPFELVPAAPADLDIMFVTGRNDAYFETRGADGESGTVPMNASAAYICLAAGAKSGFTYTAF